MIRHPDTAAIVLAGGRSSRMGSPKALLPFGDRPLIAHIVRGLGELFGDVVVVAAPGQELPSLAATVVHDDVAYQGPVGGICYGLGATDLERAFVTACDSAFLNVELISALVARAANADIVVPRWEERLQPLHAVYRRSVLPIFVEQLARGELRPVSVFDKVRTTIVDEAEIRSFDPEGWSFFNMNTPAEYAAALDRWRELQGVSAAAVPSRAGGTQSDVVECVVELFGVARMIAGTSEHAVTLPPSATCSDAFAALLAKYPALGGRVITRDGSGLLAGYACNVNGRTFVRDASTNVQSGDRILILAADAGG